MPLPSSATRYFYSDPISAFLDRDQHEILGLLTASSGFAIETTQRCAWVEQITILKSCLSPYRNRGQVYFEYSIPRLGTRADVILLLDHVLFVMEFKVGESRFTQGAIDQVWDYALDLKNFHKASHCLPIAPVLIATAASAKAAAIATSPTEDHVLQPIPATPKDLAGVIRGVLEFSTGPVIDAQTWASSPYAPTPTIVEAAVALYAGHAVEDISRSDASATNLTLTTGAIDEIIAASRREGRKCICFVTGVPGAGKTLVGLNVATRHFNRDSELYSVFLSGNGPLVAVLREALTRDKVRRARQSGQKITKTEAGRDVKVFIQNVHHFRDDCLVDSKRPPIEHVAIFDEAQRAWNAQQTAAFMHRKKGIPGFEKSEPEFLISCLDRHKDWAVIVCLVGGGQEIHTGEAGIGEWINCVRASFPEWHVHISPRLTDSEYGAGSVLHSLEGRERVVFDERLHLAVSMRSFRAETVSSLVKCVLDMDVNEARRLHSDLRNRFPMLLTRDLGKAKTWLRQRARGTERCGIVVSSTALRLKPLAIDVRPATDPVHWFLNDKRDVRSSYYLEDVATQFQVQGLELDWVGVVWDGDFRHSPDGWRYRSFEGSKWRFVKKSERQKYLQNAYRVLLTRARQGMVIVVPHADPNDHTRSTECYDATYTYLSSIGLQEP